MSPSCSINLAAFLEALFLEREVDGSFSKYSFTDDNEGLLDGA